MSKELVLAPGAAVASEDGFAELSRKVPDRDLLRVVEVVLSVYLGEGRTRRADDVYLLSRTIAACARTDIIRDGVVVSAPFPNLREMPWPHGAKGLRVLGLTRADLNKLWLKAQHEQGTTAVLDRKILATLVPLELWAALAALVQEGPGIVVERLERYLLELSIRAGAYEQGPTARRDPLQAKSDELRHHAAASHGHLERSAPSRGDARESAPVGCAAAREGPTHSRSGEHRSECARSSPAQAHVPDTRSGVQGAIRGRPR